MKNDDIKNDKQRQPDKDLTESIETETNVKRKDEK